MNVDELLREAAPDIERSRARTARLRVETLSAAVRTRRGRSRRRAALGVLVGTGLGLGAVGGVAYATGTVPALVTSMVDDFGHDVGIAPADRPEMTQIVDLELPDGTRFAAWRGVSDDMWCTAYLDRWDGQALGSGGGACGDDGSAGYELNRQQIAWARDGAGTTYYPVLFGEADPGAVEVRVSGVFSGTGEQVALSLPVDPGTSAFAAVLPGTNDHPWAYLDDRSAGFRASEVSLEFVDAEGHVLRTVAGPPA